MRYVHYTIYTMAVARAAFPNASETHPHHAEPRRALCVRHVLARDRRTDRPADLATLAVG